MTIDTNKLHSYLFFIILGGFVSWVIFGREEINVDVQKYEKTIDSLQVHIDSTLYKNIKFIDPLGYLKFISYIKSSKGIISDSGGIQCEAAFFQKPTLTLRPSTEHLITLDYGNRLGSVDDIIPEVFQDVETKDLPMIWDGNASDRIVEIIE